MEDEYAYDIEGFSRPPKVKFEDLVDMPMSSSHIAGLMQQMRHEAMQRAMQKPYRQLNDNEREIVPAPEGLGTLYG